MRAPIQRQQQQNPFGDFVAAPAASNPYVMDAAKRGAALLSAPWMQQQAQERADALKAQQDASSQQQRGAAQQGDPNYQSSIGGYGGPSGGLGKDPSVKDFKQGGNKDAFISAMMPHAMRVSEQTGLDPRLIIAQAAQETGWGKSAPGNNYFGIKSHGQSGGNTMATNEVVNGQTVRINDSFRGYRGMGESVDGYGNFLSSNPRYRNMLKAGNLDGQLAELGRSGYATDPNYAASVGSIARGIQLQQPRQSNYTDIFSNYSMGRTQ